MVSPGVLDVLHCVLIDSPEALNVIKEQHIRTIISLIDKHGRDPKVRVSCLSRALCCIVVIFGQFLLLMNVVFANSSLSIVSMGQN